MAGPAELVVGVDEGGNPGTTYPDPGGVRTAWGLMGEGADGARIPVVAITGAGVGAKREPPVEGPTGCGGPVGGPVGIGVLGVCEPAGGGAGRPLEPAS